MRHLLLLLALIVIILMITTTASPSKPCSPPPSSSRSKTDQNPSSSVAKLTLINTKRFPKALCLDQSPGGRYELLSPDPLHSHQVYLHMEGGAWSTTEADSYSRSKTSLGSSSFWNPELDLASTGIFHPNCDLNPQFCNMSHHYIKYCDGCSHGGTAQYVYQGHNVTMWGDYVLTGHLTEIFEKVILNMKSTGNTHRPEVVISGCSAGGLASLTNTWKIEQIAKAMFIGLTPIISTIPCSGIFPLTSTVDNNPNYPTWMASGYNLAKPRYSPNDQTVNPCITKFGDDAWRCMFGETHVRLIETPIFVINSVIDSWSLPCIHGSKAPLSCGAIPQWKSCVQDGLVNCTASQVQVLKDAWIPTLMNSTDFPTQNEQSGQNGEKCHQNGQKGQNGQNLAQLFINSQVHQDSSETYHNLATKIAWEQNRAMYSFIDPNDATQRINIEKVPENVDLAIQKMLSQNRFMTPENLSLMHKIASNRYDPSAPSGVNGLSLPPLSGAFLHTCHTHCEGAKTTFASKFSIDGISITTAVNLWYEARINKEYGIVEETDKRTAFGTTPHVYLPCTLQSVDSKAQCNPTCGGN